MTPTYSQVFNRKKNKKIQTNKMDKINRRTNNIAEGVT